MCKTSNLCRDNTSNTACTVIILQLYHCLHCNYIVNSNAHMYILFIGNKQSIVVSNFHLDEAFLWGHCMFSLCSGCLSPRSGQVRLASVNGCLSVCGAQIIPLLQRSSGPRIKVSLFSASMPMCIHRQQGHPRLLPVPIVAISSPLW